MATEPNNTAEPKPASESADRGAPRFSTLAVHAGEARRKPCDSMTDPIFCASTFTFENTQAVIDYNEQKTVREEYSRYGHPGERVVERKLAALDGAEAALLFSSGMAAIVGLLMAKLGAGDEVIFFDECYHHSLESHRDHEIARQTMRGFGGLVTFLIQGADWRATADIIDRVRIPRIGPSLGGVESLIEQPLVMSYSQYTPEERQSFGIPDTMIRLSCGIENGEDLIEDLRQALE